MEHHELCAIISEHMTGNLEALGRPPRGNVAP
jgi:hypothetical protein